MKSAINKLTTATALLIFTVPTVVKAAIFSAGETVGLCLRNPDAADCAGVDCTSSDFATNPLCLSETRAGAGFIGDSLQGSGVTNTTNFASLVIQWINFFLPYLSLAAFVGFVYAGFLYVTAFGNDEQLQKSKKILIWSIVGLILVISSFTIVQFFTVDLVEGLS